MTNHRRKRPAPASLALAVCAVALVACGLVLGCSAGTRHKVLSTLFDGVPPPKTADTSAGAPGVASGAGGTALVARVAHEPFAAKQCDACHDAKATNNLVAPKRELCFQCHDFQPFKQYVHGPLASGGCLLCHDPHDSPNRNLLVDESDGFCLRCHDRADLRAVDGHEPDRLNCTECHEAHMSDRKYLLR